MRTFLTTTWSPMMLKSKDGAFAMVEELSPERLEAHLLWAKDHEILISAVGHEVTAQILTKLLGFDVEFSRINIELLPGDKVIAVVPSFRATEAREFTEEEVRAAGFRAFTV